MGQEPLVAQGQQVTSFTFKVKELLMNAFFTKYRKAITALVTGNIGWAAVVIASSSGPITASEWLALAVVEATALGVYAVANG